MENKNPEGIANRKLGVGDYVIYIGKINHSIHKYGWIYKITRTQKSEFKDDHWKDKWSYQLNNGTFWTYNKDINKITTQEYIVAKLKGRLYE